MIAKILAVFALLLAILLALLLVLLSFLLLPKVSLYLRREMGEELRIRVKFGWFTLPFFKKNKEKKQKKTKEVKNKKVKSKPSSQRADWPEKRVPPPAGAPRESRAAAPPTKDQQGQADRTMDRWRERADMLRWACDVFRDTVHFRRLEVELMLATADAARTGILLGEASALGGLLLPAVQSAFVIDHMRVRIDADFEKEETEWRLNLILQTRLIRLLIPVVKHHRQLFDWYKKEMKYLDKGERV